MMLSVMSTVVAVLAAPLAAKPCVEGDVCRLSKSSFNFLVLGDWGGQASFPFTTIVQTNVARAADVFARDWGSDAVLAIGDNFYHDGVTDEFDPRFQTTFLDVYGDKAGLQTPWYVIAGNHDHYGNVSGQIAYSQHNNLWTFPDYNYTVRYALTDGTRVDLVMIDTVLLIGSSLIIDDMFEQTEPMPERRMSEGERSRAEAQWAWLEAQLAASTADFLFVVGHYPIWSSGHHGPTKTLVSRLLPLLQKYRAQMYVSGHDHDVQHIVAQDGVHQLVSGAAAKLDISTSHIGSIPKDSLKFRWPNHHSEEMGYGGGAFAHVSVTKAGASVRLLQATGRLLHSFDLARVYDEVLHDKVLHDKVLHGQSATRQSATSVTSATYKLCINCISFGKRSTLSHL